MIEVRWKRPHIEHSWRYGEMREEPGDDVCEIFAGHAFHVIRRKFVQIKVTGPRGGITWKSL